MIPSACGWDNLLSCQDGHVFETFICLFLGLSVGYRVKNISVLVQYGPRKTPNFFRSESNNTLHIYILYNILYCIYFDLKYVYRNLDVYISWNK